MSDLKIVNDLEARLNQPVGEILAPRGAMSDEMREIIAQTQAYSVHLRNLYLTQKDTQDENSQQSLSEYFQQNEWVKDNDELFLAQIIFDFNDDEIGEFKGQDLTPLERAKALNEIFKEEVEDIYDIFNIQGLSFNERQKIAERVVNKKAGVNTKMAQNAVPIGQLFESADPGIKSLNHSIFAAHYIIRSGLSQILNGVPEPENKGPIMKPRDSDPQYLHDLYDALQEIKDTKTTGDNIAVINQSLTQSILELKSTSFEDELKQQAVNSLIKDLTTYRDQIASLADEKLNVKVEKTTSPTIGLVPEKEKEADNSTIDVLNIAPPTNEGNKAREAPAIHVAPDTDYDKETPGNNSGNNIDSVIKDIKATTSSILQAFQELHQGKTFPNLKTAQDNGSLGWINSTLEVTKTSSLTGRLAEVANPRITFKDKGKRPPI